MHIVTGIAVTLGLAGAVSANLHPRSQETRDFFALHLDDTTSPSHIAQVLGARHEGQIGQLDGHHTFSLPREETAQFDTLLNDLRTRRKLRRRDGIDERGTSDDPLDKILWSHKIAPARQRLAKRLPPVSVPYKTLDKRENAQAVAFQKNAMSILGITDPIFREQWHLINTLQPGHDLNVTGVWLEGITGKGVATAVVDDGLDMDSNDLKPNYLREGSWDFNEGLPDPRPLLLDDKHGTRCCGEIAAAKNDVCGVGVAYDSKIAGIRILSKPIDDVDEAAAINFAYQKNDIYSCSWGPIDDGATMDAPGILIKRAMTNGIQKGRGGKGSVYVFAAGNGAAHGDNCNFDGYTNSIYSITVGAIDREGKHPSYSESCSAQLVVAYSSGSGDYIHTTDVGANKCFSGHGGTSAAGPLAAGSVALALSARPELTWRDLQYLMVETAVPVSEDDGSWQVLPSGRKFSHDWGFGKVDTYTMVQLAKTWDLVKPQAWLHTPWLRVHQDIPQGDRGLLSRYTVTGDQLKEANMAKLEHVTVTMNVNHTRRGDISVEMHSPAGIVSYLSVAREKDDMAVGYEDWTFMSVAHWGESPIGDWSIIVKDSNVNEHSGTFIDWRLNLWGEAIDGAKQKLHPLPDEHDDDHPYEDAPVATTSIVPAPTKTAAPANPDDHHDRPVNAKPQPSATKPTVPVADEKKPTTTTGSEAETPSPSSTDSGYISSYLPTFGASKRTQIWIYASLAMIITFFIGLGVYFQLQRVKRRRTTAHDDYEFEMIEDEDEMQPMTGAPGRTQRRGGELYNAFAGESDDEMFSDDDEPYHDGSANIQEKDGEDGTSHGGPLSEKP
ncbi:Proprotein convertase P [Penicillium cf. griseofulvum]|uniref:Proprotein convertase P n=1 Tax=Penicillium cf. griseofulvum TaxID=2972120 RepID=A0A9W9MRM6_9EURO|nr:Proprotein convertase P [Penicillium cf. griseofulvum]KAJ5440739.1 Proprotein convertase P [Penicillium cf. griseofulvum]KAJ5448786.1 Proprotein convertase P [Penicillium cf. griseofulvum]